MRKTFSVVAAAALLSAAVTGCSTGGATAPSSGVASDHAPSSVTIAVRGEPGTFDPYKSLLGNGASQAFDAVYDTLVRSKIRSGDEPVSGDPVTPALASSWKVTGDSVEFALKDGLTCADGSPLTASDIADSVKRFADPKFAAQDAITVFGPAGMKSATGDDAANTVTVTTKAPHASLLSGLSSVYIICPKGIADDGKLATDPNLGASGPYTMTASKSGYSYTFTKRPDDAAIDNPDQLPDEIVLRVVGEDATRANLLESGDVDIAPVLGSNAKRLEATRKPIVGAPSIAHTALMNQHDGHATQDKRVREAVSYAIDAASYTQAATFGAGKPSTTLYTPNTDCYTAENAALGRDNDLAKAKELIAEAGYGPGGKPLTLNVVGWNDQKDGIEYAADALRQLGATVTARTGTQDQVVGILFGKGDWDVVMVPMDQTKYSPLSAAVFVSDAFGPSLNVGGIANKEYDKLAAKADQTPGTEGCKLWGQAEAALLNNADVKPLTWMLINWFANDGLTFDATYLWVDSRTIRTAKG